MGLATSAAYLTQLMILIVHFLKCSSYFRLSFQLCRLRCLKELISNGSPALVKKLSGTLRDILINYDILYRDWINVKNVLKLLYKYSSWLPEDTCHKYIDLVQEHNAGNREELENLLLELQNKNTEMNDKW